LFTNNWLILIFYIDDITTVYHIKHTARIDDFEHRLIRRFEIRVIGEINHFLGIRIIRKRDEKRIYMIQDSYIQKIQEHFQIEPSNYIKTPILAYKLVKNETTASKSQIKAYQNRIGYLTYTAIISRPDITKAISKLAEFQQNPSRLYIDTMNHYLKYLISTKNLAIIYNSNISSKQIFMTTSDTVFSNDPTTRYSSNGFCFQLYGGVIHYKATKQYIVTTSSTEAELPALSTTAKEFI
jgi:hypothetical protein